MGLLLIYLRNTVKLNENQSKELLAHAHSQLCYIKLHWACDVLQLTSCIHAVWRNTLVLRTSIIYI